MTNTQSPLTPAERERRDELLRFLTRTALICMKIATAERTGDDPAEVLTSDDLDMRLISPVDWKARCEEAREMLRREGRDIDQVLHERVHLAVAAAGFRLIPRHAMHAAPAARQ